MPEAFLYRDGRIGFNYGAAHTGISAPIGLSTGDNSHHAFSSRNNATSIPASVSSLFNRASLLPPGLNRSASAVLGGTVTQEGS